MKLSFNLTALNLNLSPWAEISVMGGVCPVITGGESPRCVIAKTEGVIHLTSPETWFHGGEALGVVKKINKIGAPINDREEAEGGESGLNLSRGGRCHAAFLSQSRLDHFLGEKRHPALCKLWIDCDCPRYKGTRVQVMIVCFWQTPPSSGYVASCSTVWFFGANRCYGDRASWLPPLLFLLFLFFFFWGEVCGLHTAFSRFWGKYFIYVVNL